VDWISWTASPEAWIALLTLTFLELVLGIDNIVLISVLTGRLPAGQRSVARRTGLGLAMGLRIVLLFSLTWILQLDQPIFTLFGQRISWRDVTLVLGGLFLVAKSTHEIHARLEEAHDPDRPRAYAGFWTTIAQIGLLDIVFSLDSVITAVGMAEHLPVMVLAIVIAVLLMMLLANPLSDFVERHPTVKILALSFLILIGVALLADGFDQHIPRGYIYFALGFSIFVEYLNQRLLRGRRSPVVAPHREE
jgi:predicted tellurium resistance membrane protein TerC